VSDAELIPGLGRKNGFLRLERVFFSCFVKIVGFEKGCFKHAMQTEATVCSRMKTGNE
jgi:hypothetical protein